MPLFGLIGYPLGHSYSADLFNERFRKECKTGFSYRLFPLKAIADFTELLKDQPELYGLNVTIPYKEAILPFLDHLEETARLIGAVNTIVIRRGSHDLQTVGCNTDAGGFLRSLPVDIPLSGALILGSGGAAKAVAYGLQQRNIRYLFVSRTHDSECFLPYEDITKEILHDHPLIVNATPAGMYPDTEGIPPLPWELLTPDHFLYDLVYNPPETRFMKAGRQRGCRVMNGEQMLKEQAGLAWDLFMEPFY